MLLTRWVDDKYYIAIGDAEGKHVLKTVCYGRGDDTNVHFDTVETLVERMAALSTDWWTTDSVVIFGKGDAQFYLLTRTIRRSFSTVIDYTGTIPEWALPAPEVGEGQLSLFDDGTNYEFEIEDDDWDDESW